MQVAGQVDWFQPWDAASDQSTSRDCRHRTLTFYGKAMHVEKSAVGKMDGEVRLHNTY